MYQFVLERCAKDWNVWTACLRLRTGCGQPARLSLTTTKCRPACQCARASGSLRSPANGSYTTHSLTTEFQNETVRAEYKLKRTGFFCIYPVPAGLVHAHACNKYSAEQSSPARIFNRNHFELEITHPVFLYRSFLRILLLRVNLKVVVSQNT